MSEPAASPSRLTQGAELLPVFAALALHSLSHNRWLLCVPAAILLTVLLLLGKQSRYSPRLLLLSAVVGGVAGTVLSGMWPVIGPIPPMVMGPLCGALVGLTTFSALCGRHTYAIIYALLLSALSAAVRGSVTVYAGLAAVAVSLLVVAFARGQLGRAGWAGSVAFGLFAVVVMGASFGLWRFVRASEGVLTDTIFRMMQDAPRFAGVGLQSEISLERQGRMPATTRLLMVVRGDRPERLRSVVYDTFDGERWTTSRALSQARLALIPPGQDEPLRSSELTLLQSMSPYLPAPAGTRAVGGVVPQVIGGWMLRATPKAGSILTLRHEAREQLPPEPPPDGSLTALPEELRAELRPLALELTRGAASPRARAETLERWFRDNFEYSLTTDLSGEGSALAVLIRERRPAWCTYFASAMAALLRSLDIPARLTGGFVPQQEDAARKYATVRERDAHAWVEVYLPEEGRFVAFDPTPWQSREALEDSPLPGPEESAWKNFTASLSRWTSQLLTSPLEALTTVASSPLTWLAAGAWVAWRQLRRYRRGRAARARGAMKAADPKLTMVYAHYLRVMKQGAGLVPGPTETDEELLSRLRSSRGEQAGALAEEFLTHYRRARYGGGAADPSSLGALTAELERSLKIQPH